MEYINYPSEYNFVSSNTYAEDKKIYILFQCADFNALHKYNCPNRLHKRDILVRINCEDKKIETLYETQNKNERIIGVYNNNIYFFYKNKIYYRTIGENTKNDFVKVKLSSFDITFQICEDRLFIWEKDSMVFSKELT